GHRPRPPHRPDPARPGPPPHRRGHRRGPHRPHARRQTRTRRCRARLRRGRAHRADRRRTRRPRGAAMTPARGFPAFPRQRAGARFATTWWGRAWLKALEDTSLDQNLLKQGRAYARTGQLGPITVSPGRLAAVAEHEHDAVVRVEQLTDAGWARILDQVAAQRS